MSSEVCVNFAVAVVGAGPAGLFAARQLASQGVEVILFNRDVKPGGLAEYGIYYDKYKMKEGLRKQFRQILEIPRIKYCGNIQIGQKGDLNLNNLLMMGFHAILVTVGAQGTKWLNLPGEDLEGVFHAKDLVYHYNRLPLFSIYPYPMGKRVALIGAGNVMMDIAHWLIRDQKVGEVVAVVRRGPAEVKFSKKEMEYVGANLDLSALDKEISRASSVMQQLGQDVVAARGFIISALPKALEPVSETRFRFDFLASPARILGDEQCKVVGLEVEDTTLVGEKDNPKVKRLGIFRTIEVDTVVYCIGDRVEEDFGLPVQWNEFVKDPNPRFPVEGRSYEAFDTQQGEGIEGVFVAGWAREASSGLVGVARKDGENGAQAILQYLKTLPEPSMQEKEAFQQRIENWLATLNKPVTHYPELIKLEEVEQAEAWKRNLPEFKFATNDEMFAAIGLVSKGL